MSRNDVILGLVALVLVVFSLVVALVIPRRNPNFPGKSLRLFGLVAVLLVGAMLAAVEVFGEPHEGEKGERAKAEAADTGPGDTGTTAPVPTVTEGGNEETGEASPAEPAGDPQAGEKVFTASGCGSCHVLGAAGASGTVGPNLDDLQPSYDETLEQVTNGGGGMPAFKDRLSEQEIQDVSAYVVESTKG